MKIIEKLTENVVAEFTSNHSMTLSEALEIVSERIQPECKYEDAVYTIDGVDYYYDDLDIIDD